MKSTFETMNAEAFNTTPFSIIVNTVLEEKTDQKINEQLAELTKAYGSNSDIVKPLAALKATKDDEAREEILRLLKNSEDEKKPLLTLDHDHVAMLAAKFSITNKEVGAWRRRHVIEMASKGLITDADIKRETFIDDLGLNQLIAKLVKAGKIVRDGDGYCVPKSATDKS